MYFFTCETGCKEFYNKVENILKMTFKRKKTP